MPPCWYTAINLFHMEKRFNKTTLTNPQRREIINLQQQGAQEVHGCRRIRVFNSLAIKGIVIKKEQTTYRLAPGWDKIDVSFDLKGPRGPRGAEYNEQYERRCRPGWNIVPEVKVNARPPAHYSNVSREEYIDKILNG